ncbi:MAG: AraC family transcriptional regulator [Oleispira sp.]
MHSSTLGTWLIAIVRVLENQGHSVEKALFYAGIPLNILQHPQERVPLVAMKRLWHYVTEKTGDESLGLSVSQIVQPSTLGALGFAILASSSLRDVIKRLLRFGPLISNGALLEFKEGSPCKLIVDIESQKVRPADESIDAFMALFARKYRMLLAKNIDAIKLDLIRPTPKNSEPWQDFFNCPIRFNAPQNIFYFEGEALDIKLPFANQQLALQNDMILSEHLKELHQDKLTPRVYGMLVTALPSGVPYKMDIARKLNVGERTLQRQLEREGNSYKDILDQVRRDLAGHYLEHQNYTMSEIVFLLGFSSNSNFSRAFKRWFQMTPKEYKNSMLNDTRFNSD